MARVSKPAIALLLLALLAVFAPVVLGGRWGVSELEEDVGTIAEDDIPLYVHEWLKKNPQGPPCGPPPKSLDPSKDPQGCKARCWNGMSACTCDTRLEIPRVPVIEHKQSCSADWVVHHCAQACRPLAE
eukprot:TRINITY_DN36955_c0_g1_i1.p3 TRINITY_DN36955_c0_g1~~TRINITY_DN36955_c0_g1_i1.p3  ORF type:complete len:129 (-),score=19.91 TRINITY_DN36955_c0_g1_i1:439-825(-)